jgi:hypothetical protein
VLIVLEEMPNTIIHARALIDDITALGVPRKNIMVILNNRIRSDTQFLQSVQAKLEHEILTTLTLRRGICSGNARAEPGDPVPA